MPADLPQAYADPDKIKRILINLLDNGLRYTPSDGEILILANQMDAKRIIVRIADSGSGIPPEERERIFEKYRQIKGKSPAHGRKGTGLGLAFCKAAIEAHGEQIWVEPKGPLSGACFAFTLPILSEITPESKESPSTVSNSS
jgi:signal transduction histidine kinase